MQQQEITGSCSFEPNSTKALKCLVSYITLTGFRMTSTEKRGREVAHFSKKVTPQQVRGDRLRSRAFFQVIFPKLYRLSFSLCSEMLWALLRACSQARRITYRESQQYLARQVYRGQRPYRESKQHLQHCLREPPQKKSASTHSSLPYSAKH